ncbi:MAG: VlmB-like protein [Thermocrispum sp.]
MTYTIGGQQQLAELGPEQCDLDRWQSEVFSGYARTRVNGHRPDEEVPAELREAGPLRDAAIAECAFQAIAEEKATRALTTVIGTAPDLTTMEYYATQLVDEVRHGRMYRGLLTEMGIAPDALAGTITACAGADADAVVSPVEEFGLTVMANYQDFHRGVLMVTVLVEGVVAPITELSEQRWRPVFPAMAQLLRTANTDELRHLAVGGTIVRRHLTEHPERRAELMDVVQQGRELWAGLPMSELQLKAETVFQQGIEQHAGLVGDYEIWDGRRLLDTTAEERVEVGRRWSTALQEERLHYMLLGS